MSKPKKLNYNGDSKVIKYLTTCVNWFLDNHSTSTLDDVNVTSIQDGQVLKYDSQSSKFVNADESGGTEVEANPQGQPTDTLTTIDIDGTIYDLDISSTASDVSYDNTTSGLTADDVQEAIDELKGDIPTATSDLTNDSDFVSDSNYVHTDNNFTSTLKDKLDGIEAGAEINAVDSVAGKTGAVTLDKTDVGLGNVDNTSDLNKPISTATQTALNNKLDTSLKGANNGLAELDSSGKVPSSQLPSYVDDVVEYASLSNFPSTGESGKIYLALDTNLAYRWSGSEYVVISPSLALGETSSTAYRGDRGKTAYDHSQTTSGNPHNVTKTDVGLGNVPNVATNDQTPTFSQASTRANIVSGEKLSVIFGKIMKFFADLKTVAFSGSYTDLTNTPSNATQSASGFMSSTDKTKLDGIENNANNYSLPTASASTKGGVKIGSNLSMNGEVLNATDTTYSNATTSASGLMSATDKSKLDGIASGAQVNVNADWNATSGDAQILNKPSIPTSSNYLARNKWWRNTDTHDVDDAPIGATFVYPTHGAPTTGTLLTVAGVDTSGSDTTALHYRWQILLSYNGTETYYRMRNGDNNTWSDWRRIINSLNGYIDASDSKLRVGGTLDVAFSDQMEIVSAYSDGSHWSLALKNKYNSQNVDSRWGTGIKIALGGANETTKWVGIRAVAIAQYANYCAMDLYANSENVLRLMPGYLIPINNDAVDLGSSNNYFKNAYINYINGVPKPYNFGSTMYVTNDTHIMKLGYFSCTGSYDQCTILVTSSFWGNQHGSCDLIYLRQSNNVNSGSPIIKASISRIEIQGSRTFYAVEDNANQRIYLYVYVTGGNSYGDWQVTTLQNKSTHFYPDVAFNQTISGQYTIGLGGSVANANALTSYGSITSGNTQAVTGGAVYNYLAVSKQTIATNFIVRKQLNTVSINCNAWIDVGAYTIPSGYRPTETVRIPAMIEDSDGKIYAGYVQVTTSGAMAIYYVNGSTAIHGGSKATFTGSYIID